MNGTNLLVRGLVEEHNEIILVDTDSVRIQFFNNSMWVSGVEDERIKYLIFDKEYNIQKTIS